MQPTLGKAAYDFPGLSAVDSSLSTYASLKTKSNNTGNITIDDLDGYKVNAKALKPNTIRIVDMTRSRYGKFTISHLDTTTYQTTKVEHECLGILPVIVSPATALFYSGIISSETVFVKD